MKPSLLLFRWLTGFAMSCATIAVEGLPKISVDKSGNGFVDETDARFMPFGVNYYRPGTGWAPQVWKQFDAEATRRDFKKLRALGGNCVRVFLTYGSFYTERGQLDAEGLERFDRFLNLAEEAGLYAHPTGPDHWEGLPDWARVDRIADEAVLSALEEFWKLFAARYRDRNTIFAYDLLNEPSVGWDNAVVRGRWAVWLREHYQTPKEAAEAWGESIVPASFKAIDPPPPSDAPGDRKLADFQRFRESIAVEWTRRQAEAIKSVDPDALVTVGLIQWSVPTVLPRASHYSAFRPEQQAPFLDFLEIHFYPLADGAYEYRGRESEIRNLAYLNAAVRETARPGKPVILGEFGWYGGGKPTFDDGRHPAASEADQARWCRLAVESTSGLASGWLNWGFHDQPEARDVSQLTGLLTREGRIKEWGVEFQKLSERLGSLPPFLEETFQPPRLHWEDAVLDGSVRKNFLEAYTAEFRRAFSKMR